VAPIRRRLPASQQKTLPWAGGDFALPLRTASLLSARHWTLWRRTNAPPDKNLDRLSFKVRANFKIVIKSSTNMGLARIAVSAATSSCLQEPQADEILCDAK
jgi:hypothetical protein